MRKNGFEGDVSGGIEARTVEGVCGEGKRSGIGGETGGGGERLGGRRGVRGMRR